MLNKDSKHLSRQMMKYVYLLSKTCISVLNMVYKYDAEIEDIRLTDYLF